MSAPAPGSAEWLKFMTASKISAVMGTSPYESKFSLWHRMAGMIGPQEQTAVMSRGHYLEPAIAAWWADRHPEQDVLPGAWITHPDRPQFGATPDRFLTGEGPSFLECKSANDSWKWGSTGAPGLPETITPGYYDQVQWQLFVSGLDVAHVAVLVAMDFREYVVEHDTARIAALVSAAESFMASIEASVAPPIDGSTFTYLAIRELHPDVDGSDFEIPGDMATRWLAAKEWLDEVTLAEQQAKSEIGHAMGEAKRARWDGTTLFNRQSKQGGTPYLVAGRNLPTLGAAA